MSAHLYHKELNKEGIAESRTPSLTSALDALHDAISRLDNENLGLFWKKTIEQRLEDFALREQLRNVVPTKYHIPTGGQS